MRTNDLVPLAIFSLACACAAALLAHVITLGTASPGVSASVGFVVAVVYIVRTIAKLASPNPAHAQPLPATVDVGSVEEFLRQRDDADMPLGPESASLIRWAGQRGVCTEYAVLFLHGFSAGPPEIEPVDLKIAEALNANLLRFRFVGHGMHPVERGGRALNKDATPENLLSDAAIAYACARLIGKRVILLGSSTGGTLATWLTRQPWVNPNRDIAALILFSPAYALCKPSATVYTIFKWLLVLLPFAIAREIIAAIAGRHRKLDLRNARQGRVWTHSYASAAAISPITLYAMLDVSVNMRDVLPPILAFANPRDPVADCKVTRQRVAEARDGTVEEVTTSESLHVITGSIMSPSTVEPSVARALAFLRHKLGAKVVRRATSPKR